MASKKAGKRREAQEKKKKQKRMAMLKNVAVFIIIALGLYFLSQSSTKLAEPIAQASVISTGAQVYADTCAACHGESGEGHVIPEAPSLDSKEHAWHHPDGQLQEIISQGGPTMPAFGDQLTNDEIFAVIRYFQTFWTEDHLSSQQSSSANSPFVLESSE
jgi:mono/diheme cytochrome c family protein